MKKVQLYFKILQLVLDFFSPFCGYLLAWYLREKIDFLPFISTPTGYIPNFETYLPFLIIISALLIILFSINRMYSFRGISEFENITKIITISFSWISFIIIYYFFVREIFFSRLVLLNGFILTLLFLFLSRGLIFLIIKFYSKNFHYKSNLLILTNKELEQNFLNNFKKKYSLSFLNDIKKLNTYVKENECDEILVLDSNEFNLNLVYKFCRANHILFSYVPQNENLNFNNISVQTISDSPIIKFVATPLDGWGKICKRFFDFIVSFFALIILSPLFILIFILIKLDSKGPVLFSQIRVGQKGKKFKIFKFRSMVYNAESLKSKLYFQNQRKDGPLFKIENDPRITKFGKILRKTSLDELPQLINVFLGDMSLVGPRPHLPEEVKNYKDDWKFLLSIKPGMSGYSQIKGRSTLNFQLEYLYDVYYIENWSFFLDIYIIIKTMLLVFNDKNAV